MMLINLLPFNVMPVSLGWGPHFYKRDSPSHLHPEHFLRQKDTMPKLKKNVSQLYLHVTSLTSTLQEKKRLTWKQIINSDSTILIATHASETKAF